jgi:hypothetical protein
MFERSLNAFWIMLGAAAAAYAWTLGIMGPSGPDSGLFPLIAGLIILGAGVILLFRRDSYAQTPDFPRGAALWRVVGVIESRRASTRSSAATSRPARSRRSASQRRTAWIF